MVKGRAGRPPRRSPGRTLGTVVAPAARTKSRSRLLSCQVRRHTDLQTWPSSWWCSTCWSSWLKPYSTSVPRAAGHQLCGGSYRSPQRQVERRRQNYGASNYAIFEMRSSQDPPRPPASGPRTTRLDYISAAESAGHMAPEPPVTCTSSNPDSHPLAVGLRHRSRYPSPFVSELLVRSRVRVSDSPRGGRSSGGGGGGGGGSWASSGIIVSLSTAPPAPT